MINKKELKEAYKQHKPQMGVFHIRNTETGQCLIDSSTDVSARWNRHQAQLRFGSHRNKLLQKDWNKLGESAFEFSLLSELEYNDDEPMDYKKELEMLKELVIDDLESTSFY